MPEQHIFLDMVHGGIRLSLSHPHLITRLESTVGSLLGRWETALLHGRHNYELAIELGQPEVIPSHAQIIAENEIFAEGVGVMAATEAFIWLVFSGQISLKIYRDQRRSRIVASPAHAHRISGSCLIMALEDAIDQSGQFILHAASLRWPDQEANILIFAPSGTGKTTTSLSLLAQGFGLCSDDATILKNEIGHTTGWGFPRHLKVHRNTVDMLPWLAPFFSGQWDDEGEQPLSRNVLEKKFRIIDKDPRPIRCIFSLARTAGTESRVTPLPAIEAAVELTTDNVRVGRSGLLPSQDRRFDSVLHMVSCIPAFRLSVGTDLDAVAPVIAGALGSSASLCVK